MVSEATALPTVSQPLPEVIFRGDDDDDEPKRGVNERWVAQLKIMTELKFSGKNSRNRIKLDWVEIFLKRGKNRLRFNFQGRAPNPRKGDQMFEHRVAQKFSKK